MKRSTFPQLISLLFCLLLTAGTATLWAGEGTWSKRVELIDVSTSGPTSIYEVREPVLAGASYTHAAWKGRFFLEYDREGHSDLNQAAWGFAYWKVRLTYNVLNLSGATLGASNRTLTVSYENGNYIYNDYDAISLSQEGYRIEVLKIEGWKGNSLPLTTPMNVLNVPLIAHDLHIRLELDVEKGFDLLSTERPTMFFDTPTSTLHWGFVEGAEWYDVEWVFIDALSEEYAALSTLSSGFTTQNQPLSVTEYGFSLMDPQPARVRVWGGSYKFDMIYPDGIVLFRIRSVGLFSGTSYGNAMTDQVKTSDWSYYNDASQSSTYWVNYPTTGFEAGKNWSYGISFAEGGKSVSSMSYYDGTLRGRQSMSYNTSDNVTLIGEAKFDYEGRQTVSVIPAPVKGRSLGYRSGFNMAINPLDPSTSIPFEEAAFDRPDPLELFPQPQGQEGGAAQYFSPENNFTTDLFRNAIPKSKGYVYSQTVYRNDGTGRIEKAGGIGEAFTADGDHTTKMYYATPTVAELKRLFGENVPDNLNGYRKSIVKDANDQYSVTFYDKRGNVIATGLVGESPKELLALDPLQGTTNITSSLLGTNSLTADGLTLLAETTIFNEIEGQTYDFSYDLTPTLQQAGEICFTCAYKLEILILGPDLNQTTPVYSMTQTINQPNPVGCEGSGFDNFDAIPFSVIFPYIGEYRVIKKLTIDQATMDEELGTQVLANLGTLESFLAGYTVNLDYSGCYSSCADFATAIAVYKYNQAPTISGITTWSSLSTGQQTTLIDAQKAIYCTTDGMENVDADDPQDEMTYTYGYCSGAQHEMELQIKPGGVYYESAVTSDFWVDVAARMNALTDPSVFYANYNANGTGSNPYSSSDITSIRNPAYFQEEWLPLLIKSHREKCHLDFCWTMAESNEFDNDLVAYITGQIGTSANALSGLDLANTLFSSNPSVRDPFIAHAANNSTDLQDAINDYLGNSPSLIDYVINDVMPNYTTGIDPALSTLQLNQISVQAFAGMYMNEKQRIVDAYKLTLASIPVTEPCAYQTDENAVFMSSQHTPDELTALIGVNLGEWTSSNCIDHAVASVNGWMQQFSVACLTTLAAQSTPLYQAPAATNPALYTAAELAVVGTPVRLEQLLYAYAVSHCGEQFAIPFYNDASSNYTSIHSICTTYCSLSTFGFEVPVPDVTTSDIINQNIGGCLEELLVEINAHMLPTTSLPGGFYDIPAGTINCFPTNITLTYGTVTGAWTQITMTGGCKLEIYAGPSTSSAPITFNSLQSISNPVKVLFSSTNWIRVTLHYLDGTTGYGFIPDNSSCNFGNWNTIADPFPPFDPVLPTWETDCLDDIFNQATIDGTQAYWHLYTTALAEIQNSYINCLSVPETFNVNYKIKQYQYTLYYYDLVGNLVQTVPPQGVIPLDQDGLDAHNTPAHTMPTRYAYNGLNGITETYTPDGGNSQLYVDKLYRVRYSQNARQLEEGKASYSKYDELGRVTEAGEFKIPTNDVLADKVDLSSYPTTGILDYTQTIYEDGYVADATIATQFGAAGQQNLRNAIGAVIHRQADYGSTGIAIAGTEVKTVISYSYDPHKNVKQLVSTNYQLSGLAHQHKRVDYAYDLISGNVNKVTYQKGASDEYNHRYHYDANNRLIRAFTSKNGEVWEMDAKYFYYLHGALARSETGHDKVQGTDYAYNLQGWLKGVNSATLVASRDLGKDADATGLNKWSGIDAVGFQLGYYNDDYAAIVTEAETVRAFANTTALTNLNLNTDNGNAPMGSLYNGNITHMISAIRKTDETVMDILGNNYQYDQLQRIREMKVYGTPNLVANNNFTGTDLYRKVVGGTQSAYQENYTFDKNGNLLSLKRNGSGVNDVGGTVNLEMDDFKYFYYTHYLQTNDQTAGNTAAQTTTKSNRLSGVYDVQETDAYLGDVETGQDPNNYQYDRSGQLTQDYHEGIELIEWTVTGKVKKITFSAPAKAQGKHDMKFIYDPMDMRIAKVEYLDNPHTKINYTYYSYDASGNVMATYERLVTADRNQTNGYTDLLTLADHQIYGSSRIGTETENLLLTSRTFSCVGDPETGAGFSTPGYDGITHTSYEFTYRKVSDKNYELANHLGNVLAVVTDRKIAYVTTNNPTIYTADVVSYSDYSPYGTLLHHRHGQESTTDYRYGFQGQEADDEIKGEGNSFNYKYRMHDPRIGRFFAIDPLAPKYAYYSPYAFSGNRVIDAVELEGLEPNLFQSNTIPWEVIISEPALSLPKMPKMPTMPGWLTKPLPPMPEIILPPVVGLPRIQLKVNDIDWTNQGPLWPEQLGDEWEETTDPRNDKGNNRTFKNKRTGEEIGFDKAQPGKGKHQRYDHWHRLNPEWDGNKKGFDKYLDREGNPCDKNSGESHLRADGLPNNPIVVLAPGDLEEVVIYGRLDPMQKSTWNKYYRALKKLPNYQEIKKEYWKARWKWKQDMKQYYKEKWKQNQESMKDPANWN